MINKLENMLCYEEFMSTLDSDNTKKVALSYSYIGNHDYTDVTPLQIQDIILAMKPKSIKAITSICYILKLYAKYLNNVDMQHIVSDIDRNTIWSIAKPNADKKFISNSDFNKVYHDIGVHEEYNGLYQQTLFRCVYEGIYNDDMSVIKNLRSSQINTNVIILNSDSGEEYTLSISPELSKNLSVLSCINTWERKNRFGTCKLKIKGLYEDSCFKVENRNGTSEYAYRFSYYRMLRKISKEYLEYSLLPLQLYVSGIMHRINVLLQEQNISLYDAFAYGNKNRVVNNLIAAELKRSNYDIEVKNFREMVQGHLDVFVNN